MTTFTLTPAIADLLSNELYANRFTHLNDSREDLLIAGYDFTDRGLDLRLARSLTGGAVEMLDLEVRFGQELTLH